jgi:hypothetical protein
VVSLLGVVVLATIPEAKDLGLKEQSTLKGARFEGNETPFDFLARRLTSRQSGNEPPAPKRETTDALSCGGLGGGIGINFF